MHVVHGLRPRSVIDVGLDRDTISGMHARIEIDAPLILASQQRR